MKCKRCNKPRSVEDFRIVRNSTGYATRSICYSCEKKQNALRNRNRIASDPKYRKKLIAKERLRRSTDAGKAQANLSHRRWRNVDSNRTRAHNIVARHLVKKPCAVCGSTKSQGHHEDYSKPFDIVWLCHIHHKKNHRIYVDNIQG